MVVILHLFDNQIFKGLIGDKTTDPVKKDGQYHITGKLAVISAEEFKALFVTWNGLESGWNVVEWICTTFAAFVAL